MLVDGPLEQVYWLSEAGVLREPQGSYGTAGSPLAV